MNEHIIPLLHRAEKSDDSSVFNRSVKNKPTFFIAQRYASAVYVVVLCLSACLSVSLSLFYLLFTNKVAQFKL